MKTDELIQNTEANALLETSNAPGNGLAIEKHDQIVHRCVENALAYGAQSIWGQHARDLPVSRHLWRTIPSAFHTYFDPFLGRGYFIWPLCFDRVWENAILGDADRRVIEAHEILKRAASQVLDRLASLPVPSFTMRPPFAFPNVGDDIGRVAQIARVGAWSDLVAQLDAKLRRSFEREVRLLERIRIRSCADVLREYTGIDLVHGDYADTVTLAKAGDFVFFDSPGGFSIAEHERLAEFFRSLSARGVICAAAIPATTDVAALYGGFDIQDVMGSVPTPKRKPSKNKAVKLVQRPILGKFVCSAPRK